MKPSMRLKILITILIFLCSILIGVYILSQPKDTPHEDELSIINDIEDPQIYATKFISQKDKRWCNEDYWLLENGTYSDMGTSACGLTCYTMTINILNNSNYTPVDINNMRGDMRHWQGNDDGEEHKAYT